MVENKCTRDQIVTAHRFPKEKKSHTKLWFPKNQMSSSIYRPQLSRQRADIGNTHRPLWRWCDFWCFSKRGLICSPTKNAYQIFFYAFYDRPYFRAAYDDFGISRRCSRVAITRPYVLGLGHRKKKYNVFSPLMAFKHGSAGVPHRKCASIYFATTQNEREIAWFSGQMFCASLRMRTTLRHSHIYTRLAAATARTPHSYT